MLARKKKKKCYRCDEVEGTKATRERRYVGWKIPSKYFLPASAIRHGPLSFDVKRSARRVCEKLRETQVYSSPLKDRYYNVQSRWREREREDEVRSGRTRATEYILGAHNSTKNCHPAFDGRTRTTSDGRYYLRRRTDVAKPRSIHRFLFRDRNDDVMDITVFTAEIDRILASLILVVSSA